MKNKHLKLTLVTLCYVEVQSYDISDPYKRRKVLSLYNNVKKY